MSPEILIEPIRLHDTSSTQYMQQTPGPNFTYLHGLQNLARAWEQTREVNL